MKDKPCDCNSCKQRRAHQISAATHRVPGARPLIEHDERDPRVVAASRRIREEDQ
jgi:hypothetical protein